MVGDKADDTVLDAAEVAISLLRSDHNAVHPHRMQRHTRRAGDQAMLGADRKRNTDGVTASQHQRCRWFSHP